MHARLSNVPFWWQNRHELIKWLQRFEPGKTSDIRCKRGIIKWIVPEREKGKKMKL